MFPTRKIIRDGSEYFGPHQRKDHERGTGIGAQDVPHPHPTGLAKTTSPGQIQGLLGVPLRQLPGPCEGHQSEEDYNANVAAIRSILKGDLSQLIRTFKGEMKSAAEALDFERAQELKTRLEMIEKFQQKTAVVHPSIHNVEVFSIVSDNRCGYVNYLKIRDGAIVHGRSTELRKSMAETDEELLAYAIVELREQYQSDCPEIYLPFKVDVALEGVKLHVPQRGDKARLLELSERNARYYMRDKHKMLEQVDPEANQKRILTTLQADLRMQEFRCTSSALTTPTSKGPTWPRRAWCLKTPRRPRATTASTTSKP